MNDIKISIDLWTRAAITTPQVASRFLEWFAVRSPSWFPLTWDNLGDVVKIKSAADWRDALRFWERTAMERAPVLFGRDGSPALRLLLCFKCKPTVEEHYLSADVKLSSLDMCASLSVVLDLARGWMDAFRADYARICTEDEHRNKNTIEQYVNPDGTIDSLMVFQQDITTGLPGVYWGTYFGKAYVEWFGGAERFEHAPWPGIERCGSGFLLMRSQSPLTWRDETTLDTRLRDWLGEDAFFDISRPDRALRAPTLEIPDSYVGIPEVAPVPREPRRARRSKRQRSTTVVDQNITQSVAYFRSLGFFADRSNEADKDVAAELFDSHMSKWGTGFSEQAWLADLELLAGDPLRVWWKDTEADVGPGNRVYMRTIKDFSHISRGMFSPARLRETWASEVGPVRVSFTLDGIRHGIEPRVLNDYIDMSLLLNELNQLIVESGVALFMYEQFDQTAFVVALTADEAKTLREERGWRFADLTPYGQKPRPGV